MVYAMGCIWVYQYLCNLDHQFYAMEDAAELLEQILLEQHFVSTKTVL
jgi:hypothetical protein